MDFGRTATFATVLYTTPQLIPNSRGSAGQVRVFLGCPVWTQKAWGEKVFPRGTPSGDFLHAYAQVFDSVELNATFYKTPLASVVERWRRATPPGFKFCSKVTQDVSHALHLAQVPPRLVQEFFEAVAGFEDRLGPVLLQLPPQLGIDDLSSLARILSLKPREICLSVEFRHPSWFENRMLGPRARAVLERAGVNVVITDSPGRRDVCHGSILEPTVFLRFAGNELHPTDELRIRQWVSLWRQWASKGVREIYFFAHQPEELTAPETLELVRRELRKHPLEFQFTEPAAVGSHEPQMALFLKNAAQLVRTGRRF